ncbi:hypothetical protein RS030_2206 [Cryptosporidium xiaoi]|uniref:Uncharacterized protein n=1 Tax=Cryptosporidium xiaoi TaxID=659607 RepID=A0AAV9XXZ7_9CRYT
MKIFSIFICKDTYNGDVKLISSCFNLSSFAFLERNAIKEILTFIVKSITPKLDVGKREIISHDKFLIFSFKWVDGTTILIACDREYPSRSAFSCINELYSDLYKSYLNIEISDIKEQIHIKEMQDYLKKYKNPLFSDAIFESQMKVEKASEAMHISLRSLLDRGENLDILLQKSQDLSDYSKKLFKTSKKTNKSCLKQLNEQKPTAPTSPTIAPVCDTNLPSTVTDEVSKVLYFGFGSFLAVSLIALAVLQVNINSVCDKNLDEVNGLSALLSLFMALLCSIISFVPSQRDIITKAFKYYELPSYKKESLWSWINIGLFILIPTLVVIHDVGGFIAISESNTCKRTAPGLFIGTSIVLSFQLLIILMLMLALFYSRMMDLIYSLPSFNIDLISELHVTLKAKKLMFLIFDSICSLFEKITHVLKKKYPLSKIKETYFNIIHKFMEIYKGLQFIRFNKEHK